MFEKLFDCVLDGLDNFMGEYIGLFSKILFVFFFSIKGLLSK